MWKAKAPINIALIKYMGKQKSNIPQNISLSYTIADYYTDVTLEACSENDTFVDKLGLDEKSVNRFLLHLDFIKKRLNCPQNFIIKSNNNFPHSAGFASSASSFAALTKCAAQAISEIKNTPALSIEEMSEISRHGSGSSCRSFFSPWCVWDENGARAIDINCKLRHEIIMINSKKKKVSSSDAHKIVTTSLLFQGRRERAQIRFEKLVDALNTDNWSNAFQICWEEFWDMHALFETSAPHFGYIESETIAELKKIREYWNTNNDGPLVTIDAGANINLFWKR